MAKSKPKYQVPKYIDFIWWQDAYVSVDDSPEVPDHSYTLTIGIVTKKDSKFITVSHFIDGIDQGALLSPYTVIPSGMVKKHQKFYILDKSMLKSNLRRVDDKL